MFPIIKRFALLSTAALLAVVGSSGILAGELEPAGPPAPSMKTMVDVEPRQFIRTEDLPLTIVAPGSYYLAEHLIATTVGDTAISVLSEGVTIDLNGFSIMGSEVGVWEHGIRIGGVLQNVTIRNGTVRDCTVNGITLSQNSIVEKVSAISNGFTGISVGDNSQIIDSIAQDNSTGFKLDASRIVRSTATGNGSIGIDANDGSVVDQCIANDNGGDGINLAASSVKNSTANNNQTGIEVGLGKSTLVGNETHDNSYAGIVVPALGPSKVRVDSNEAVNNGSYGILVSKEGSFVVRNMASGNGVQNYFIPAGVAVGQILDVTGAQITTTNPWRNLEF